MTTEIDIKECNRLHTQAMERVDAAFVANHKGEKAQAAALYREAYDLEVQAVYLIRNRKDLEPTRSVLYRSAASLGLQIGEFDSARRLACKGLAGSPPDEIAEELRDVLRSVEKEQLEFCV